MCSVIPVGEIQVTEEGSTRQGLHPPGPSPSPSWCWVCCFFPPFPQHLLQGPRSEGSAHVHQGPHQLGSWDSVVRAEVSQGTVGFTGPQLSRLSSQGESTLHFRV